MLSLAARADKSKKELQGQVSKSKALWRQRKGDTKTRLSHRAFRHQQEESKFASIRQAEAAEGAEGAAGSLHACSCQLTWELSQSMGQKRPSSLLGCSLGT